jgi:hypothetical protein
MWIGEYQQGDRLPLVLWARTPAGTPTLPDDSPRAIVSSSTGPVLSKQLPAQDQSNSTALFLSDLNLDGRFGTGLYTVQYIWKISSTVYSSIDTFNILGGGDANGTGIAIEYFSVNPNKFLLVQTDNGTLIRRRNPRIT